MPSREQHARVRRSLTSNIPREMRRRPLAGDDGSRSDRRIRAACRTSVRLRRSGDGMDRLVRSAVRRCSRDQKPMEGTSVVSRQRGVTQRTRRWSKTLKSAGAATLRVSTSRRRGGGRNRSLARSTRPAHHGVAALAGGRRTPSAGLPAGRRGITRTSRPGFGRARCGERGEVAPPRRCGGSAARCARAIAHARPEREHASASERGQPRCARAGGAPARQRWRVGSWPRGGNAPSNPVRAGFRAMLRHASISGRGLRGTRRPVGGSRRRCGVKSRAGPRGRARRRRTARG